MPEDIYLQTLQNRGDGKFMDAFNAIEHHLRTVLNRPVSVGFSQLVTEFYTIYPRYEGQADLRAFASLRNTIVHGTTDHEEPLFLPSPTALTRIERIRDELLKPSLVLPKFGTQVLTVDFVDSVASVLSKIASHDFSQFPVYGEGIYQGLLTENGITRWMAQHVQHGRLQVDLDQAIVRDLMDLEEARGQCRFIRADTTIPAMLSFFSLEPALEAVLISETGQSTESLLGIANVYDVLEMSAPAVRRTV